MSAPGGGSAVAGRAYALASASCFATLGVFSTAAYDRGTGELELLSARIVGGALVLGAVGALLGARLPRGRLLAVVFLLGCFQLGTTTGLLVGFNKAPVALVVLMFYVYPTLVSLGAAALYGEPFGRRHALVLALSLVGVALTVGRPGSAPLVGILLGLLAAASTTAYFLGSRFVLGRGVEPLGITTLLYSLPGAILVGIALVRGFDVPSAGGMGGALGVVLLGTVFPILMVLRAIVLIGAATTALLSTVEPFVAVVLAYVVLDERLTSTQLLGGACIVSAVLLSALPARSPAVAVS
ncbi:MAG TPA: DMT family transporter [Gaiellaceae bacterium]